MRWRFVFNIVWKTLLILAGINLLFVFLRPLDTFGVISAYNKLFPGRWRLPWSENPSEAYNLSLTNLNAMFASHEVSDGEWDENEFRVFVVGDSSVWGFLLKKEDTITSAINDQKIVLEDGRAVRAYNLGYPTISLLKDVVVIDETMQYQPDLIVWFVTLEAFPEDKQLFTPFVVENHDNVLRIANNYNLDLMLDTTDQAEVSFWDKTVFGSRREAADLIRLQLYGVQWAATGIDQYIPESYTPLQSEYGENIDYYGFTPQSLTHEDLAFDVLRAGVTTAGEIPVLIVNEPIYISGGENSDLHYNFFYPRWVYDQYREWLEIETIDNDWHYLDLWDVVPSSHFTNTAIHYDAEGVDILAEMLGDAILEGTWNQNP